MQQQLEVAREVYLLKVVTEKLQAAIGAREVPALEEAIAAALEVQLQSPLVGQARQLLALRIRVTLDVVWQPTLALGLGQCIGNRLALAQRRDAELLQRAQEGRPIVDKQSYPTG